MGTQDVLCDGFPELPLVSCHLTIASVILHNCGRGHTAFSAENPTEYCPGLPSNLTDPNYALGVNLTFLPTPRNIYELGS